MKKQLKQIQNQAQEGRSMVEMLGVLAIIGVLSIGGIAGYRMAMNRYQANQIANEINLMRTDAKMKVARGVELLLGSPYDDEKHLNFNANYGVEVKFEEIETDTPGETEKGYSFTLSNIPDGVCRPLVTLLDNMDDTADITIGGKSYYDENASEDFCGETNEVMVAFSTKDIGGVSGGSSNPEEPEPECNDETCLGGTCNEGVCKCNDPTEYWTGYGCTACPEGARQEDGTCKCTEEGSHLKGSACITCPAGVAEWSDAVDDCVCKEAGKLWTSDGKCIDNVCNNGQPCPDDEDGNPHYCYMSSISCDKGVPSASSGTCTSVTEGSYREVTVTNGTGTKTIYVSKSSSLNWWAADAFCQALGRKLGKPIHLVSVGDLGCPKSNASSCPDNSYGKSLANQLRINDYGWTSTTVSSTPCRAYNVSLDFGDVYDHARYSFHTFAFCE